MRAGRRTHILRAGAIARGDSRCACSWTSSTEIVKAATAKTDVVLDAACHVGFRAARSGTSISTVRSVEIN